MVLVELIKGVVLLRPQSAKSNARRRWYSPTLAFGMGHFNIVSPFQAATTPGPKSAEDHRYYVECRSSLQTAGSFLRGQSFALPFKGASTGVSSQSFSLPDQESSSQRPLN